MKVVLLSILPANLLVREFSRLDRLKKRSAISMRPSFARSSCGIGQNRSLSQLVSVNTNFDVSQKKLSESLDFVVDTVVSQVGVNVNSPALLSHVAEDSIKPFLKISSNTVRKREKITSRSQIKSSPSGAKSFKTGYGFLRIPKESSNILDNTGVHPENYAAVKELFKCLRREDLNEEAKAN